MRYQLIFDRITTDTQQKYTKFEAMRNQHIDSMRSIAILIMLTANTTPYLLEPNAPFAFRALCSLAAPLFTFLSGYTFAMNGSRSNGFKSGFFVLLSAVIVDVFAWGIPPFQTFDVLYVIALGQFALELLKRLPSPVVLFLALIIVLTPTVLQTVYRFELPDPNWHSIRFKAYRWAFDGWFPIFPWLSFPLLGYLSYRWKKATESLAWMPWISAAACIGGAIWATLDKNSQAFREGYVEIFYPANLPYLSLALGFCCWLLFGMAQVLSSDRLRLLNLYGRHSMFVYIFHAFIIAQVISRLPTSLGPLGIFAALISFYAVVYLFTFVLERLLQEKRLSKIPSWVKKPFGLY